MSLVGSLYLGYVMWNTLSYGLPITGIFILRQFGVLSYAHVYILASQHPQASRSTSSSLCILSDIRNNNHGIIINSPVDREFSWSFLTAHMSHYHMITCSFSRWCHPSLLPSSYSFFWPLIPLLSSFWLAAIPLIPNSSVMLVVSLSRIAAIRVFSQIHSLCLLLSVYQQAWSRGVHRSILEINTVSINEWILGNGARDHLPAEPVALQTAKLCNGLSESLRSLSSFLICYALLLVLLSLSWYLHWGTHSTSFRLDCFSPSLVVSIYYTVYLCSMLVTAVASAVVL